MPDTKTSADELDLNELQSELEANQRDAARIKALLADVKKTVDAIEQKKGDLAKAAVANDKLVKELNEYVTREKKMLETTVDHDAITAKNETAKEHLADLQSSVSDAEGAVAQGDVDLLNAQAATGAAQKEFDAVAGRVAANNDLLKELAALRAAADKQGASNNLSRMYFLLLVMDDRLAELKLTDPDAYAAELKEKGTALAAAKDAEHRAEAAFDKAKSDLKTAQKAYQDERAKYVQNVLGTIDEGDGQPTADAAADGSSGPA